MKRFCPCDVDGICPYDAEYSRDCEYWCAPEEPEDYPEEDYDYEEEMYGYDED